MKTSPWTACLTRLVVTSVTMIASFPTSVSLKPKVLAGAMACRRTSATWLASVTSKTNCPIIKNLITSALYQTARLLPLGDDDFGASPGMRRNRELVHQTFGATKAEPQSIARCISVLHGQFQVG